MKKKFLALLSLLSALFLGWIIFILAGCSVPAQTVQIAAYRQSTPIARYPSQIAKQYHASMEIRVANLEYALQEAYRLTSLYGGFVNHSFNWSAPGYQNITLEVFVPSEYFEALRQSFLGLGILIRESAPVEQLLPAPIPPGPRYTQITLLLQAKQPAWLSIKTPGWNPAETFQRAFGVFMAIFGFIVDLLIWVVVVAGPFLLIGGVIAWLIRRRSKSRATPPMESPGGE